MIVAALPVVHAVGTLRNADIMVVLTGVEERLGPTTEVVRGDLPKAGRWLENLVQEIVSTLSRTPRVYPAASAATHEPRPGIAVGHLFACECLPLTCFRIPSQAVFLKVISVFAEVVQIARELGLGRKLRHVLR